MDNKNPVKNLVMLEYAFMFDPKQTWSHIDDFEDDLAAFFKTKGLEAQIISPINGYKGRRILFITPDPTTLPTIDPSIRGKDGAIQMNMKKVMKGVK